jgi:hypothetical protein
LSQRRARIAKKTVDLINDDYSDFDPDTSDSEVQEALKERLRRVQSQESD